ncbi:MAG: hypothetical protein AAFR05_21605, partial [Bacteroidota bacterium]
PEKRSVEQNQNLLKLRAKTFFRHTLALPNLVVGARKGMDRVAAFLTDGRGAVKKVGGISWKVGSLCGK